MSVTWQEFLILEAHRVQLTEAEKENYLLCFAEYDPQIQCEEKRQRQALYEHKKEDSNYKKQMSSVYSKFKKKHGDELKWLSNSKRGVLSTFLKERYTKRQKDDENYIRIQILGESFHTDRGWIKRDDDTSLILMSQKTSENLTVDDINNLPAQMLRDIDQYWLECSNNNFGLSVQSNIYIEEINAEQQFQEETWREFGTRINWRSNDRWFPYKDLNYSNTGSRGHLPRLALLNDSYEQHFKHLFHALLWRIHNELNPIQLENRSFN